MCYVIEAGSLMRFNKFLFNRIWFVSIGGVMIWAVFNRPHIAWWRWVNMLFLWVFFSYMGSNSAEKRRLEAIERAKPLHVTPQYDDHK